MSLDDLPVELWRKILLCIIEPELSHLSGVQKINFWYYALEMNIALDDEPKGHLLQIPAAKLHSLLLVSKRCYTLTMSYLWSNYAHFTISTRYEKTTAQFSPPDTSLQYYPDFRQQGRKDILTRNAGISHIHPLYASSLSFVTHLYVDFIYYQVTLVDRPHTEMNVFMMANPVYMPNLKFFSANIHWTKLAVFYTDTVFDVEKCFIGTTYYTRPISIALEIDFGRLEELANSLAKPALLLVTSLKLGTNLYEYALGDRDLPAEQRSISIINQMLNLEEFSVNGWIASETYFHQVLSCLPTLKVLNLSGVSFGWDTPNHYINIGQSVTKFYCKWDIFEAIIREKLLLPNVKKLSVNFDHYIFDYFDCVQESFTNLEELVCFNKGREPPEEFKMAMDLLQSNKRLKHFTMTNFDADVWDQAKDKMTFPNVDSVRLYGSISKPKSKILPSLFKMFPFCEYIEFTTHASGPVVDYQELKDFVLSNPNLRYIMVDRNKDTHSNLLHPYSLISGFPEITSSFLCSDFCRSIYRAAHFQNWRGHSRYTYSEHGACVIDAQALRQKIDNLS